MKYLLLAFCLFSSSAFALSFSEKYGQASSSQSVTRTQVVQQTELRSDGVTNVSYAQRVLFFDRYRSAISDAGQILVCLRQYEIGYNDRTCTNNKHNMWKDIHDVKIPGFKLVGYRLDPQDNYNYTITLYFRKE